MDSVLLSGWQLALRAEGHPENTVTTYGEAIKSLKRHLGDVGLLEVTRTHIRAWIVAMRDLSRSPATISSHLAAVKQFYRWLVAEGETDLDPTTGITGPARPDDSDTIVGAGQGAAGRLRR